MNRLGNKQQAALEFIRKVGWWHSYARSERKVIASLAKRGLVEDSTDTLQYRYILPQHMLTRIAWGGTYGNNGE